MSQPLTRQMRQVLAELELISHGSVQSWNSDGRGGFDRLLPPGELDPPHLRFRRQWDEANSDEARAGVYREARDALTEITRRSTKAASLSDRELLKRRILEEGRDWPVAEVARTLRTTVSRVRKVRLEAGLDSERGTPLTTTKAPSKKSASRAAWAQSLSAEGLTQAEIAERMGVSQPTVHRLLSARRFDAAA